MAMSSRNQVLIATLAGALVCGTCGGASAPAATDRRVQPLDKPDEQANGLEYRRDDARSVPIATFATTSAAAAEALQAPFRST